MMPTHSHWRRHNDDPAFAPVATARTMQQDPAMSPSTTLDAPRSGAHPGTDRLDALRELDRPTETDLVEAGRAPNPGTDGNYNDGGGPESVPVVRNARVRSSRETAGVPRSRLAERVERLYDQVEAFVSRLSVRDNFWHSVCSLIWLPLAFFSGIRLKMVNTATRAFDTAAQGAEDAVQSAKLTAAAVLPFRRFNRNWYRAMAGGALLANSEIAGGMYVFGIVGGDYTVVCKHLEYRFLRPCLGPAVYRMNPRENVQELVI